MESMLDLLSALSVSLAALVGILRFRFDSKDDRGELTRSGRLTLRLMIALGVIGLASQTVKWRMRSQAEAAEALRAEARRVADSTLAAERRRQDSLTIERLTGIQTEAGAAATSIDSLRGELRADAERLDLSNLLLSASAFGLEADSLSVYLRVYRERPDTTRRPRQLRRAFGTPDLILTAVANPFVSRPVRIARNRGTILTRADFASAWIEAQLALPGGDVLPPSVVGYRLTIHDDQRVELATLPRPFDGGNDPQGCMYEATVCGYALSPER